MHIERSISKGNGRTTEGGGRQKISANETDHYVEDVHLGCYEW